jgi:hypothetical protein
LPVSRPERAFLLITGSLGEKVLAQAKIKAGFLNPFTDRLHGDRLTFKESEPALAAQNMTIILWRTGWRCECQNNERKL